MTGEEREQLEQIILQTMDKKQKDQDEVENKKTTELEEKIYVGKKVEYYSKLIEMWIESRFEIDKRLLTLSTSAIGGLLAIAVIGEQSINKFLLLFALSCFALSITSVIAVLKLNTHYLDSVIKNEGNSLLSKILGYLDIIALVSFGGGIVLSVYAILKLL